VTSPRQPRGQVPIVGLKCLARDFSGGMDARRSIGTNANYVVGNLSAVPDPIDKPRPEPPAVTPPLPPDFPDIPQNPPSELRPPLDPSARPDKVEGTTPFLGASIEA
jgi:hypothetical protein